VSIDTLLLILVLTINWSQLFAKIEYLCTSIYTNCMKYTQIVGNIYILYYFSLKQATNLCAYRYINMYIGPCDHLESSTLKNDQEEAKKS
jgi:hypothetical protein